MTFLLSSSLLHPPRWDDTTVVSGKTQWQDFMRLMDQFQQKLQASAQWQTCFHCGKKILRYSSSCSASFHREFPVGSPSHQDSSHPLAHSLSIVLQLLLRVKINHTRTLLYLKPFHLFSFHLLLQSNSLLEAIVPRLQQCFLCVWSRVLASCLPDGLRDFNLPVRFSFHKI